MSSTPPSPPVAAARRTRGRHWPPDLLPVEPESIARRLGLQLPRGRNAAAGRRVAHARHLARILGFEGSAIAMYAHELVMPAATVHELFDRDLSQVEIADRLGVEMLDVARRLEELDLTRVVAAA